MDLNHGNLPNKSCNNAQISNMAIEEYSILSQFVKKKMF